MPSLYRIKPYLPKASYHVFNRGANDQKVFFDKNDYWVFRRMANQEMDRRSHEINIETFSLLDNHFHFRIYQETELLLPQFIKSLTIRYIMYLNKKYRRNGQLFQGIYKAIFLASPEDIRRVDEYILNNPINKGLTNWPHVGRKI